MQLACRGSRAAHATPPIPVILIMAKPLKQQFETDAAAEVEDGRFALRLEGPPAIPSFLPSIARSLSFSERAKTHCVGGSAFCDVTKGAYTDTFDQFNTSPPYGCHLVPFFQFLFSHTRLLGCGLGLKIRILNGFMKPYCAFPTDMIQM